MINTRSIYRMLGLVIVMMAGLGAMPCVWSAQLDCLLHLQRADGLLHDNATSVAEDSLGYIWIGTHRGLNRYDGYRLDGFTHKNESDARLDRVYGIAASGSWLMVATECGLSLFNPVTFEWSVPTTNSVALQKFITNARFVKGISGLADWCWVVDSDGRGAMLRADASGKIEQRSVGNDVFYTTDVTTPCVAYDTSEGTLWVSGRGQIEIYRATDNDKTSAFTLRDRSSIVDARTVVDMAFDSAARKLWIGLRTDSIVCAQSDNGGNLSPVSIHKSGRPGSLKGICLTADYACVLMSDGDLLSISKRDKAAPSAVPTLTDANSIFADTHGRLWITGWMSGAAMLSQMPIGSDATILNGSTVSAIVYDNADDYLYAAVKFKGIYRIDPHTAETVFVCNPDPGAINALSVRGQELIVSTGKRVLVLNKQSGEMCYIIAPRGEGYTFWTAFDRHNQMWIATYHGLERWRRTDSGRWAFVQNLSDDSTPLRLSTYMLHNIAVAADEIVVTSAKGVNRIHLDAKGDPVKVEVYQPEKYTWAIAPAPGDNSCYWIAAMGTGLQLIDFNNASAQITSVGAPSDIEAITVDRQGRVWTSAGDIRCYDPQTSLFTTYSWIDGLQRGSYMTSCSATDADGVLWFGGSEGLDHFMPEGDIIPTILTHAIISRIIPQGNGEIGNDKVRLSYPDNGLTIQFTTLAFGAAHHVRYRYRMAGLRGDDWHIVEGSVSPEAVYTRLPYGKYSFEVEGGDHRGWSGHITRLEVVSVAPWWASNLAYVGYFVALLALLILGVWYLLKWTRMKRDVALAEQAEAQERASSRMKERFFTDISHELRTPLTLIRHAADRLSERLGGTDSHVQLIVRNAATLTNMVNELLEFHRADSMRTTLHLQAYTPESLIRPLAEEFGLWATESGLHFECDFDASTAGVVLNADREIITKMASNILANAIRYTPTGGTVALRVGIYDNAADVPTPCYPDYLILDESLSHEGRVMCVSVSDTGYGITPEELPTIFDRLQRVDNNEHDSIVGSGIGLALVRALAGVAKASIMVGSAQGIGSEFKLVFPAPQPDEAEDTSESVENSLPEPKESNGQTVLIVEDHPDMRNALRELFAGKGFQVVTAADSAEALEAIDREMPDIVVSDVMMPGMPGTELCRRLKNDLRTCHLPVVLLTAMAHEESQIEGLELGADAYIAKPFNPRLLIATVNGQLNRVAREAAGQPAAANVDNPSDSPNCPENAVPDRDEVLFRQFEALIKANLSQPLTVDDLWRVLGTNRTYLFAIVKAKTGIPLGAHIKGIRLDAAKRMLSPGISIAEVAMAVGIDSPAYFSRAFKERFGITPSEYIKNQSNA